MLLLLLLCLFLTAIGGGGGGRAMDPGYIQRCGQNSHADPHLPLLTQQRAAKSSSTRYPTKSPTLDTRTLRFNITLHVFEDYAKRVTIPQSSVDAQFSRLQHIFASQSRIELINNRTVRYNNNNNKEDDDDMSTKCLEYKSTAMQLAKTADDGASSSSLHVFICQLKESSGVLGYAQLPCSKLSPFSPIVFDGAAWVDYRTLPGGEFTHYNLGNTMVHELGHVFGLLHTFHGESCTGKGDLVADTPTEKTPYLHHDATDCTPTDSCPKQQGRDPVQNYMNYSPDACMTEFTPGQTQRMKDESQRCLASRIITPKSTTTTTTCATIKTAKQCNAANNNCRYLAVRRGVKITAQCRRKSVGCRVKHPTSAYCAGLCANLCRQEAKWCVWRATNKTCMGKN